MLHGVFVDVLFEKLTEANLVALPALNFTGPVSGCQLTQNRLSQLSGMVNGYHMVLRTHAHITHRYRTDGATSVKMCAWEGSAMLLRLIASACLVLIAASAWGQPPDAEPRLPELFIAKMTALIKHYYPGITIETIDHEVSFAYRTRTFMIHHGTKTGQWQDARPERGPQPDGILCLLSVHKGRYVGAACLPQTFDHRYFKVLAMAADSKNMNCYLHAQLHYPEQKTSPVFLRSWSQLVDDFEQSTKK